jgi:hypothetical protein
VSRASDRQQFGNDMYESFEDFDEPLHCRNCGSEDVRWRQQGGKWVLFSLTPGVVHVREPSADDFGVVEG